MSDSLHIVAVSEYEVGVFSITLKPPVLLEAHADFLKYVDSLPESYDPAMYQNFITFYGTHYPTQVTLGGRARMKTVISNAFFSTQSDSSITASVSASWGSLGGGGGGSSASNTTTQEWKSNSDINTETVGGDPSINAFCNMTDPQADCYSQGQGWANWVKSVEHGAPVVTSMQLEPVWSLVPPGPKQDNVMKAVQAYASNATWPSANLPQVRMDWCDCEKVESFSSPGVDYWSILSCHSPSETALNVVCPQGKFATAAQARDSGNDFNGCDVGGGYGWNCCRPCFTAAN
jgi:hypothetical protein